MSSKYNWTPNNMIFQIYFESENGMYIDLLENDLRDAEKNHLISSVTIIKGGKKGLANGKEE